MITLKLCAAAWRLRPTCSLAIASAVAGLSVPMSAVRAASYRDLLPPIPFATERPSAKALSLAAKTTPKPSKQEPSATEPSASEPRAKSKINSSTESSAFGKVRTDDEGRKVHFIADYILLRGLATYQRHVFRQDGSGPLVVRHRSQGIDFDYEELRVTADLGQVRLGGVFFGAEESGAEVFGEWPIADRTYLGTGFSAVTMRTHNERYRRDQDDSESREAKWNNYALSGYLLHSRSHYELKARAGLSRKRFTRHETASLKPAGGDHFHRDFRSGFGKLRASVILPVSASLNLLLSYSYYYERMYEGTQIEGPVKSAVDGVIENHYFDLLHIRYTH